MERGGQKAHDNRRQKNEHSCRVFLCRQKGLDRPGRMEKSSISRYDARVGGPNVKMRVNRDGSGKRDAKYGNKAAAVKALPALWRDSGCRCAGAVSVFVWLGWAGRSIGA